MMNEHIHGWGDDPTLQDHLEAENARLIDELARLRAIVDKLLKTADGILAMPNTRVWRRVGDVVYECHVGAFEQAAMCLRPSGMDRPVYHIEDCYSTEAAAREAAGKERP